MTERRTDIEIPVIYCNLASSYADCGKKDLAKVYFAEALRLCRTILGEEHIQMAYIYNQMGSMYNNLYQKEKSEEFTQKAKEYTLKAVDIAEKQTGDHSDLLVTSYNNLGNLFGRLYDIKQANFYMEKSINLKKEIYGESHPEIGMSYMNTGTIFRRIGNYEQAIALYQKAEQQFLANDSLHYRLIDVYFNLGSAYDEQGEKTKALAMFEKGENVVEHVCSDTDADAYLFLPYIYDMLFQLADSTSDYHHRFVHYLDDKAILAIVPEGIESPAEKAGMKGMYYVLKYNNWTIDNPFMFFNYIDEVREQPKDVIFMRGDDIIKQHFEKKVGVNFLLRYVSSAQQQQLRKAFHR